MSVWSTRKLIGLNRHENPGSGLCDVCPFPEKKGVSMAQITRKQTRQTYDDFKNIRQSVSVEQLAHMRAMQNAFFAGVDPRRRRELADSGMVHEDHTAMANLSPVGYQKEYPKDGTGFVFTPYLDDTREG